MQYNGIYNFPNLPQVEMNNDTKAYFKQGYPLSATQQYCEDR